MARTTLLSVLSAFLLACGGPIGFPTGYIPEPGEKTRGVRGTAYRVVASEEHNSDFTFRHSEYYRIGRFYDYPVFILIVDFNDFGCIVPAEVWALNPYEIMCPSGWVFPRPRFEG